MNETKVIAVEKLAQPSCRSVLDQLVQEGARRMLQSALENEVDEYIQAHGSWDPKTQRQMVVRNGRLPQREILTGAGPVAIEQPRVRHRDGRQEKFSSAILPPYLRRVPSLDALIPALYLRGISSGDFQEALKAILGEQAVGLSATNIVRLKESWQQDFEQWSQRDLSKKNYVYWWADGIHFNVRLEEDRTCILVIMGALEDGTKELVGLIDGYRESKTSWEDLLRELKDQGLCVAPRMAVADGALGFWAALEEVYGSCVDEQRCWVHKTANILDKMPKGTQPRAKEKIHDMYLAETKAQALKAYEHFVALYQVKYPKATECLKKDKEVLFAFYDYPAEHWVHLRTTNPIESTFATVRHRTQRTKGCGTRKATLTMVFKLAEAAQKKWRKLNAAQQISKVIAGIKFADGLEVTETKNVA